MQDIFTLGLAFTAALFVGVVPVAVFSLAIPYAVLRLRNEEPVDPQLGVKVGLQYFFSLAVIVALAGLTIMAVDLCTRDELFGLKAPPVPPPPFGRPKAAPADDDVFNSQQRTGVAMVLSGLLLAALHLVLSFALTDRAHWHRVRRIFAGWRFAIHGLVVTFALIALVILVFRKDSAEPATFRSIRAFFAVLVVWVPSWAVHVGLLKLYAWLSIVPARTAGFEEEGDRPVA